MTRKKTKRLTPAEERAAATAKELADQERYREIIKTGEKDAIGDHLLPAADLTEWRAAIRELDILNGWEAA